MTFILQKSRKSPDYYVYKRRLALCSPFGQQVAGKEPPRVLLTASPRRFRGSKVVELDWREASILRGIVEDTVYPDSFRYTQRLIKKIFGYAPRLWVKIKPYPAPVTAAPLTTSPSGNCPPPKTGTQD